MGAGPSQVGPSSQPGQMPNGAQISPTHYQPQPPQNLHNLQPISTSFGGDAYQQQAQHAQMQQQQQHQQHQLPGLQMDGLNPMFPQYFPVFDYGHVGSGGQGADMFMPSPVPMEGEYSAGGRYSPEASMQSSWQDFVAQMGMQ